MNINQKNPYIGPRTFQRNEGHLFFGRERESRDLISLVASERLVIFYAQSGAGKSSIVNTRLLPNLEEKEYEVLPVGRVSGDTPAGIDVDNIYVYNLLRSLEQHDIDPVVLSKLSLAQFLCQLNFDEKGFFYDASLPEETDGDPSRVIRRALVVDQFEELFSTHPEAWEKREGFFQQVAQAMQDDPHLWVVLVMREDFIAALDPYAHLMPGGLRVRYYMQRLEREAALKAVKSPVADIRPYAEGVAEKLIDDLCSIKVEKPDGTLEIQPGQYMEPVQMQVVCYGLWENLSEGNQITEQDLQDVGDVDQSLGKYYDRRVNDVATAKNVRERLIREWFEKKLITTGGIRNMVLQERETKPGELGDDVIQALQSDLVRAEKRGGATWYELTHDRLVEPILERNKIWFNENLSPLQRQAALWKDQDQNESWLLSDQALVEVETWAKENPDELTDDERDFLEACQELQAQIDERHANERMQLEMANKLADEKTRSAKRSRIFNVISVVLVLIALYFLYSANQQKQIAVDARSLALTEAAKAEQAKNQALEQSKIARSSDLILRAIDTDQPDLAALLKIEAFRFNDNGRTRRELLMTLQEFTGLQSFWKQPATQMLFSPDGKTIATLDKDGITLWDLESREKLNPEPINEHFDAVYASSFSPDGKYLASGSSDSSIVLWSVEDQKPPRALTEPIKEHTAWVDVVAFSPKGSILASASDDLKIILWDVSTPSSPVKLSTLSGHNGWISSLAFSSDGNMLVSGSTDYTVFLWNVSDPKKPEKIGESLSAPSNIYSLALSKDNKRLAAGSYEGLITLWDISNRKNPSLLSQTYANETNPTTVYALAFSPVDESLLAVGSIDSMSLWDISDPEEPVQIGESLTEHSDAELPFSNSYVYSVVFSPDGKTLASSSNNDVNGYLILWDISNPEKPRELASSLAGSSRINTISFDRASGTRLVTGSSDGSLLLWDVSPGKTPVQIGAPQKGHKGKPTSISFNTDGSILNSIGDDGTVLINAVSHSLLGSGFIAYPLEPSSDDSIMVVQYLDGTEGKYKLEITQKAASGQNTSMQIEGKFLAIGPTSETLVYTTLDDQGETKINLWDMGRGETIKADIAGSYLGFSPDGKILAYQEIDGDEQSFIHLLDTRNGNSLTTPLQGQYASFTPDSKVLLYQTAEKERDSFVAGWDVSSNKPTGLRAQGVFRAMGSDGKTFVSLIQDGQGNNTLNVVTVATGENTSFKVSYEGDLNNIFLANNTIFYQAYDPVKGQTTFNLLNMGTGLTVRMPTYDGFASLSPNHETLVYQTYDFDTSLTYINLLDMTTGVAIGEPMLGSVSSPLFIPNTETLISNVSDPNSGTNSLVLLNTENGLTVGTPQAGSYAALSPDNNVLIVAYDSVNLVDVTTGLAIGSSPPGSSFLGFSKDGKKLIYQRSDAVGLLDMTTGRVIGETIIKGINPALQPNGDLLATTGENGIIYFWDISKAGGLGKAMEDSPLPLPVKSTAIDQAGKNIAIIKEDGISLQDLATGKVIDLPNHHVGGVKSIIFNPDGKTLLSVGEDGKSILWDLNNQTIKGKPITGIGTGFNPIGNVLITVDEEKHITQFMDIGTSPFESLGNPIVGDLTKLSPDGNILVVTDSVNSRSTIIDLNKLEPITDDPITGTEVQFSPTSEFVAISDNQNTKTTLLNLITPLPMDDPMDGVDPVFSADGKFMVMKGYDLKPTIWSLTSSKVTSVKNLANPKNSAMMFSPDGKFLLLTDEADNVTLWNLAGLRKSNLDLSGGSSSFSPKGKYLAASTGNSVLLWDLSTVNKVDITIEGTDPVFSLDDNYLAVSNEGRILIWDLTTKTTLNIPIQGTEPVFSPDNNYLAVTVESDDEQTTVLWDLSKNTQKEVTLNGIKASFTADSRFLVNTSTVYDLKTQKPILEDDAGNFAVSSSDTIAAIYGSTGIVLWDKVNSTPLGKPLLGHSGSIIKSIFSPDGNVLASIASDGIILSNISTGEQVGKTIPGTHLSFDANGKFIAVGADANETDLWDISNVSSFKRIGEKPLLGNQGTFSPDGNFLTTTDTEAKSTIIWDTSTWEEVNELPGLYSFYSDDGKKLAVINAGVASGDDKAQNSTIAIWDLSTQVEVGKITLEKPCPSDSECNLFVSFSSDGRYLAYNDSPYPKDPNDPAVTTSDTYLWDLVNQEKVTLSAPIKTDGGVNRLDFIFDNLLVVESSDGGFTIWETPSGTRISNPIRGEFQARVSIADQNALLYISELNRDLILWAYAPEEWANQMCEKVGRNFTSAEWKQIFTNTFDYRKTCPEFP